jgi:hypothetical protein
VAKETTITVCIDGTPVVLTWKDATFLFEALAKLLGRKVKTKSNGNHGGPR